MILETLLLSAATSLLTAPGPSSDWVVAAPVDTIISVSESARFRLDASAGRVSIRVWDRSAVRVLATATTGTTVRIEAGQNLVSVTGSAGGGVDEAEYEISLPRRMAVAIEGGDLTIDIKDCEGEVNAKNHSGSISLQGTRGRLTLKSVLGEVSVRQTRGSVSVQSQYAPIRLMDVTGDVEVEGSAGHIVLERVDTRSLSASTVAGVIRFSGPLHGDGHYSLSTHSGSVFLTVPMPVHATVHVSTVSGAFASPIPMTREEGPRRGRFTITFGNGAASVDVDTFNGGIVVQSAGP
jgi:hypothetical protein